MNIFGKLSTLVQSVAHGVLDAAIDMNSVQAVKVQVRKLETARDKISDGIAVARGRNTTLAQDIKMLTAQIESAKADIDLLLGDDDDSNDHQAVVLETRNVEREQLIADKQSDLNDGEKTLSGLEGAYEKINRQHQEMLAQVRKLEQLDKTAKAKDNATAALKAAASLTGEGALSVDNIAFRMREHAATADAKFEHAVGSVGDSAEGAVLAATAAARIAARKAELKKQAEASKSAQAA